MANPLANINRSHGRVTLRRHAPVLLCLGLACALVSAWPGVWASKAWNDELGCVPHDNRPCERPGKPDAVRYGLVGTALLLAAYVLVRHASNTLSIDAQGLSAKGPLIGHRRLDWAEVTQVDERRTPITAVCFQSAHGHQWRVAPAAFAITADELGALIEPFDRRVADMLRQAQAGERLAA